MQFFICPVEGSDILSRVERCERRRRKRNQWNWLSLYWVVVSFSYANQKLLPSHVEAYAPQKKSTMSTRALRRLKGKQRGQEALDLGDLTLGDSPEEQAAGEEEQLDTANVDVSPPSNRKSSSRKAKKNKAQKNFSNIYELVKCINQATCFFNHFFP